jgi:hypothetical protein
MSATERSRKPARYHLPDLLEMRRTALRTARSLPMGPERNQQRQIAASLKTLTKNDDWLAEHVLRVEPSRIGWSWHSIDTAPFDLPLELAVIDEEGPHTLAFPCVRISVGGWSDTEGVRVFIRPAHWREWQRLRVRH